MAIQLFHFYSPESLPKEKSRYSHFGWEGNGTGAWSSMLWGYKNGLDALFEKYIKSAGDFNKIDTLVYPICFLSRQIIELAIKYLFLKYSDSTEEQKKDFLNTNHNLHDAWQILRPFLSRIRKEVTTEVSIGEIEDIVLQMNDFDETSMRMRYPVAKDLKAMNNKAQWLDMHDLYNGIDYFFNLVMQLVYDFDRKVTINESEDAMKTFAYKYKEKKKYVIQFLNLLTKVKDNDSFKKHNKLDIDDLLMPTDYDEAFDLYDKFDDDTKIVIECLYYSGRAVHNEEVNLPKNNGGKILCVTYLCIEPLVSDKHKSMSS